MPAVGLVTAFWLADDWSCVAGADLIAEIPVLDWSLDEQLDAEALVRTLSLRLPMDWSEASGLEVGQVIQRHVDLHGTRDYDEFRIMARVDDLAAGTITLLGFDPLLDLAEGEEIVHEFIDGVPTYAPVDPAITPADAITTRVLAYLPAHWSLGTVLPTDLIAVTYGANSTPLAAARAIVAAVKVAAGFNVGHSISARRNGTTGYALDLTLHNVNVPKVHVHTDAAQVRARRRIDRQPQGTRVYFGDRNLHRPTYQVLSLVANTSIALGPHDGLFGPGYGDDCWNGLYWVELKNGTAHTITDTDSGGSNLHIADTSTISVGDLGYFASSASREDLVQVTRPDFLATYGPIVKVLPPAMDPYTNLLRNADFHAFSAGVFTDWTVTGNAVVPSTTPGTFQYGGQSLYSNHLTQGNVITQSLVVYCEEPGTIDIWFQVYVSVLSVGFFARLRDPQSGANVDILFDGSVSGLDQANTLISYRHQFAITTPGAKTVSVGFHRAVAGASVHLYVDAAQLVWLPGALASAAPAFRAGSGAARNLDRAAGFFASAGQPRYRFEDVEAVDRALVDPHAPGPFRLGASVRLLDPVAGEWVAPDANLRIVGISRRSQDETRLQLKLITPQEYFSASLGA